ncbi:MAG: hypothetical protein IPL26_14975 [Leptospiraceae bacterium]|nr:hypothetical protein [Leptospiraceae bacterium]
MTTWIEFENRKIEVVELEREHYNFILYKDINSEDHYLFILLNHSSAYYLKIAKIAANDIFNYQQKKINIKTLVDTYR